MTAGPGAHRALRMLELVGHQLPGIWKRHATLRDQFMAEVAWEPWCYAPMAVALSITSERTVLAAKLTALAAWRMTQGIYRVDETLLEALTQTPLDAAVPVEVLRRLPEWCVYIELPGIETFKGAARGVWVLMESAGKHEGGAVFLTMLFDTDRDFSQSLDEATMLPLTIKLSGESLLAAIESTYPAASGLHGFFERAAKPVLSILLYLCSANAELTRGGVPATPIAPKAVRTRRDGWRVFPAPGPVNWELGVRMGAALRAAFASAAVGGVATGRTLTPHVRAFHWHTFLSGPRKGVPTEKRQRDIRWLPPIEVNIREPGELVPVVRPVRQ